MARVQIDRVVLSGSGVPASGATVQVKKLDGTDATVYAAETGGTTVTNPLTTIAGTVTGWLDPDSYDLVVSNGGTPTTRRYEAALGSASGSDAVTTVAAAGASYTVPQATGIYDLTLTAAALTLTIPAPAVGKSFTLLLRQDATGSRVVTWPTCKWPGGAAPQLTTVANGVDVVSLLCINGADWLGFPSGYDFR